MISVIVPIYNVDKYLEQCLLSIRQQTFADLQVIMVNDGSTDNSAAIAARFVAEDKRFILIEQTNKGQSAARNLGLKEVIGEYISFIDADDYLAPDFYEQLMHGIKDADMVQIGYTRVDETGKQLYSKMPCNKYQFTTPWSKLIRREWLDEIYFMEGYIYEDILFSIDIWARNPQIKMLDYTGYFYRTNPYSTTSRKRDTKPLFSELCKRAQGASYKHKMLILWTSIRLRFHFLLGR